MKSSIKTQRIKIRTINYSVRGGNSLIGTGISESVEGLQPVRVTNRGGTSPYVVICDHASNFIPPAFADLGLQKTELDRHIAWDPGAAPVARHIAGMLDATLVESCISRLVIDCNRPLHAPDLISAVSETTVIPGNEDLSPAARQERIACSWQPFHETLDAVIGERLEKGLETRLVTIHSFTPVYKGVSRPWHIGIIHDEDERIAAPLLKALRAVPGITVGANEPYSPSHLVYFTLERHARAKGLACAMVEIRNDIIADEAGQSRWAELLAAILPNIRVADGACLEKMSRKGSPHA
jgi:predicted N-formylglutamate amidohydrolase